MSVRRSTRLLTQHHGNCTAQVLSADLGTSATIRQTTISQSEEAREHDGVTHVEIRGKSVAVSTATVGDVAGDGKRKSTRERKAKVICAKVDNEGTLTRAAHEAFTEEITTTVTRTRTSKRPRNVSESEAADLYPNYAQNLAQRRNGRKWVGAHVSSAGGVDFAVHNALRLGANGFALFLKSPRRWESPAIQENVCASFVSLARMHHYTERHIVPHGCYLVNLANGSKKLRKVALDGFLDDICRCESIGVRLFNFHPGSFTAPMTRMQAVKWVAEGVNEAHRVTKNVVCLLENMAGQGNTLGCTWEDLRDIIELVDDKSRVGVCFDTCHAFAAGHDIRTAHGFDTVLKEFDSVIGLQFLRAVHLNDSKGELGCRKDRHENIGQGKIGLEAFRFIMNSTHFDHVPMLLETPQSEGGYAREIELLYSLVEDA